MSLHIETGHSITKFVANDGRTIFEVRIGKDGRSIEVIGVGVVRVNNVLYGSSLAACPNASNSLTIRMLPYND